MTHTIELYFDEKSEAAVRAIWTLLESAGVESPGRQGARPSVRLCLFDSEVSPELHGRIAEWLQASTVFDLLLSGCGSFPGVVFLAPRSGPDLLDIHARLRLAVSGTPGLDDSFRTGHWIPACILAAGLDEVTIAEATAVARTVSLPIPVRVVEAGLAAVGPWRLIESWQLRARTR